MVRAAACLIMCFSWAVYGQAPPDPQFEIASVKLSNTDLHSSSGIKTGNGRLDAENVTLKRCIMGAYGVGPHQISGGPDWLDSDRFQISAKADQLINDDAVLMKMLKDLLRERFHLEMHHEVKMLPALILKTGKSGPKLEKAEEGEAGTNTTNNNANASITAHNTDMDSFARVLARQMDLPVVNQTGLEGIFNFKLEWVRDNGRVGDSGTPEGATIFTAIQEQLGLHLRSQKSPVEVLVIDRAERPSQN